MEDINYLSKQYDPLSDDDLNTLVRQAHAGDTASRDEIVLHNTRLVVHFAKSYMNGKNIEDVMSEGIIGLLQSVDRFDPDRGYKFSTYATWWIRQAVQREIYSSTPLHLSQHDHEALPAIRRSMERNEHNVDPCLLVYLHMTYPSLDRVVRAGDDENLTLGHIQCDPHDDYADVDNRLDLSDQIESLFTVLNNNEREVMTLHYGLGGRVPLSIKQIARRCGVSRQAIDLRYNKAWSKLRAAAGTKKEIAS